MNWLNILTINRTKMVIGCGSIAQVVLSKETAGGFLTVNFGWWLGVMLGVYVCGGVSGGHINPAITLAMAILGRTPWHKVCFYWTGQYLGAITGAAVVYGVYFDALNDFDGGVRQIDGAQGTAGIFGTYPKPFLSWQSGFGDQVMVWLRLKTHPAKRESLIP
ncbi:PREDICTED: aquaporin-9-like [Priapulus caudatus]|uniref:Aquaporin-9-like n=1 Tax=Priapulus caudatus TaxID=37621 RepID=A0ABM1EXV4_PRICU|nr:PREDICTED: aquaporin-9-like [Priapulus caudatus]